LEKESISCANVAAADAIRSPFGSLDYIVKSDWKLEDVVKKIREKLKI
jgi:hypothetical protein